MGTDTLTREEYTTQVRKVLTFTLVLNLGVSAAKVIYGYLTNSVAIMSDGFHSLFDGVSNVLGLIGIWIASNPPDENHPYGHRKYETLFTIIIGFMILITGYQILKMVFRALTEKHATVVTQTSFIIMLITMAVNIFVMLYETKKGKQYRSEFLVADAMHTKSDIFVSLSVIASLIFTKMGYPFADALVGIVITFFIVRIGYGILKDTSDILVDTVCIDTTAIKNIVNGVSGVMGCHDIRSRGSLHSVYLDMHVTVDCRMSTGDAHAIADAVEKAVEKEFPNVVDVMVHIEPDTTGE
jgi:cation diffusion facilitator family transporter